MKKIARFPSLMVILAGYLVSLVFILILYRITGRPHDIRAAILVYDIVATFLIFLCSLAFNNSSFYDPYWSVAPLVIFPAWYMLTPVPDVNPVRQWLILILVFTWSFRLTYNWIRRWKGLHDEDWRYAGFRSYPKPVYWLISFTGFHFFPTLIVFAGCLSAYPAMCSLSQPLGITDALAVIICLAGIAIETIADAQLKAYLRNRGDKPFLSSGLWKYARHPNYLGEIMCWTGLFCFSLPARPFVWYTLAGPLAMILMFFFISVPMMDKRMKERNPGYTEYARRTSAIVLWGKKA